MSLIGKWVPSEGAGQSHELQVASIDFLGQGNASVSDCLSPALYRSASDLSQQDNPIQKQSLPADFLRTISHLRMRTSFQSILHRTRALLIECVHKHFHINDRAPIQVHPPLITSSDCEGAGEAFTILPQSHAQAPGTTDASPKEEQKLYFREPKYLTVSAQLHLEAYSAELGNVWALSPTFRAEESDTPRHLSEFYMLEAEYREINLRSLCAHVRRLVHHLTHALKYQRAGQELLEYYADSKHRSSEADFVDLQLRWNALLGPWDTISYTYAMGELQAAHDASQGKLFVHPPQWGKGLQLEHERWIVTELGEDRPVFVTHYPKHLKPFYMRPTYLNGLNEAANSTSENTGQNTVSCFDLLLPFGCCEVAGGSLREHRLEPLIQAMREKGLLEKRATEVTNANGNSNDEYPFLRPGESLGNLKWYADLRRFGSAPHGGFGLGFDRLLAYLTGVSNLRDVVPFPRTWGKADC